MAANREYAESTAMKRGIIIHDSIFSRRTMDHSECSKIGNIIFSGGAPWKRVKSPWGEDFVHVNQKEYVLKMSQVIIQAQLRIMRIISYWSLRFIYCDALSVYLLWKVVQIVGRFLREEEELERIEANYPMAIFSFNFSLLSSLQKFVQLNY